MKRKIIAGVVSVTMAAGLLLTGCQDAKRAAKQDETLTLTMFMYDGKPFKDDFPIYQKAEEYTGIHIHGTLSQSTSNGGTALQMMMSSGDLADIVHLYGRTQFAQYGADGAFVPLNDLIDKYAPNFKKFLEERPDVKKFITALDGNIYFIPYCPDGKATKGWFIRQDWLNKVNMEAPANIDELYQVMKAFKEQDPNGNGIADEVPYFNRDGQVDYENSVTELYSLWNLNKSFMAKDGKVIFCPMEPDFKEATKTIAKWYKEGLIDTEIYTRGNNTREYMLGNNLGGITHDWFASTADYNGKLKDQIEGFEFVPFAPPAGPDGVSRELSSRDAVSDVGWAISSTNKHPEETMKWLDFWWTEEGRRLMNYGIEGEDYDMIDGKPVFKDSILHGEKAVSTYLQERGAQGNVGFHQDYDYEKQWMNPIALKGVEEYEASGCFQEKYPVLLLDKETQDEYDKIIKDIETYRDENMQKWILGDQDVDATYDSFVQKLKELGIDRAIEIQQKAYDEYKKD